LGHTGADKQYYWYLIAFGSNFITSVILALDFRANICYTTSMTDIISNIRTRFDHAAAKKILKEKYQAKMLFAHAGGMWRAGPELNTMIFTCGRMGEIVLPDLYENPVRVDSVELMKLSQERWNEQMNAWLIEWTEVQKQR
jgi:hypothetical protein